MKRVDYLDYARALGMFLVYYGHFVEALYRTFDSNLAFAQLKLVYSFHVPFFFFLSGIFWKPEPFSNALFFHKIKTRLLPWLFFSLLLAPFWMWLKPEKFLDILWDGKYLMGYSQFNFVLWFLICLLWVELLAALIVKFLKVDSVRLLVYAVLSFCFGHYVLVQQNSRVLGMTGINPNTWFVDESFIALLFYFLGYISREALLKMNGRAGWWISLFMAPISAFLLWKAFKLNTFGSEVVWVLMANSVYGNMWLFALTALIGILFMLFLSRLISFKLSLVSFIGQNTLIFLGLNGIGLNFLDLWALRYFDRSPSTSFEIFLYASFYVSAVMLLSTPLVFGIRRWFPELAGYKWESTSLIPPIQEWPQRGIFRKVNLFFKTYLIN